VGIAAVAGAATLGLWTIAWRLLQVPFLLFQALWHVSFPAMAQLIAGGEDPRPVVERLAGLAAAGTGLLLTALVASTPSLIPALFGDAYAGAREAIPPVCAALQISGPVSVAAAGYLFASGQAGVALRAALLQVVIWFSLALPLLPVLGVRAVGLGFCVAALAETVLFVRAVHRHIGARLVRGLVAPFAAAALGSACGWLVAEAVGASIPGAIAGGAVGTGVYLAVMLVVGRALVVEVAGFVRRGAVSLVRA
jgi:O-antigen/teichoic acid export membrane protein